MSESDENYHYVPTALGRRVYATPATEASRLLESLRMYHGQVFDEPPNNDFIKTFIEPLRRKRDIDTAQYFQLYESALELTVQKNGKPLKLMYREIVPRVTCFWAACANYVKAENFAEDFPNAAWCHLMDGWFWYGLLRGRSSVKTRSEYAKEANASKLKVDPKQTDKELVKVCWYAWQMNPADYDSKSAFALDMLRQFPNLKSQRVICEKWCPAWEKENITLPAK